MNGGNRRLVGHELQYSIVIRLVVTGLAFICQHYLTGFYHKYTPTILDSSRLNLLADYILSNLLPRAGPLWPSPTRP
jgi:hypothetical protein